MPGIKVEMEEEDVLLNNLNNSKFVEEIWINNF